MRRIVVLAAILGACGDDPGPRPTLALTARVMSINIRHDVDEPERRLPLIADEIVRLQPDLIGLQEIEIAVADQSTALLGLIADRGGLDYEYYEHLKWGVTGDLTGEGVGIFSRWPIRSSGAYDLQYGDRVSVWSRVEVSAEEGGYLIDMYNTHLEPDGEDRTRVNQLAYTLEFMAMNDEAEGTKTIKFLTGDLNTTDDSMAIASLGAAGFVDTYKAIHGAEANETGATSPIVLAEGAVQDPIRRIDYVFVESPGPEGTMVTPTDSIVCFENADSTGFYPSDHLGVMTTLDLVLP